MKRSLNIANTRDIDLELLIHHIDAALSSLTNKVSGSKIEERSLKLSDLIQPTASDFSKLLEGISQGVKTLSDQLSSEAQTVAVDVLKGCGNIHWAAISLLAIGIVLERLEKISYNDRECIDLLNGMNDLAKCIKQLKDISDLHKEIKEKMSEGVHLIVCGSIMCCSFIRSKKISKFFLVSKIREELVDLRVRVDRIFRDLMFQMQMKTLYFCSISYTSQLSASVAEAVGTEQQCKTLIEEIDSGKGSSSERQTYDGHEQYLPQSRSTDGYKIKESYNRRPGMVARLLGGIGRSRKKTVVTHDQVFKRGPRLFTLKELKRASNDFQHMLGKGGFGSVFKGTLQDGKQVAIKKVLVGLKQEEQFLNEVDLNAFVQHRNIVKLIGCCIEGGNILLVYDYLPNGSLDRYLFNPEEATTLDWESRMNIIVGVARGLVYVHEDSEVRLVHRDIKPANILLDEKFNAKIADFGLATLLAQDGGDFETSTVAGTCGYMAPEYFISGHLTEKADIYSFGVLVMEVISGKRGVDFTRSEYTSLLDWAWKLYEEDNLSDLLDFRLRREGIGGEISRVMVIALLCTQEANLRPPMSQVLFMLSNNFAITSTPIKPSGDIILGRTAPATSITYSEFSRDFSSSSDIHNSFYRAQNI